MTFLKMITVFNEILYRPLFNLTVWLYNVIPGHDFGLAIIVLTLLVRILFFPLSIKSTRSQMALNSINPQVKAIKDKYKNDKAAQSAAILRLYKDNKINPLSGCLPLLIQLPILIALYQAFIAGFKPESLDMLYSFIGHPGAINKMFLGILDITSKSHVLAIAAGVLQFIQVKKNSLTKKAGMDGQNKELATLNSQMLYFLPIFIIIIGWSLPAGLLLYWVATTVFSILEQMYIVRKYK